MIIVAMKKAKEIEPEETVLQIVSMGVKTTKEALRFIKSKPDEFTGKELQVIKPGKLFKVREKKQTEIIWDENK